MCTPFRTTIADFLAVAVQCGVLRETSVGRLTCRASPKPLHPPEGDQIEKEY